MNSLANDEILIRDFQTGKPFAIDSILTKYKTLVNSIARRYYLIGGDQDDLIQEGMIGLYKACVDFASTKNITFKTFAYMCIQRQIQSAIKADNRQKNFVLNNALSYDSQTGSIVIKSDPNSEEYFMYLPPTDNTPENQLIENENYHEKIAQIKSALSRYEYDVFNLYLQGYKTQQIAAILSKDAKSIDNALVRLKQKLDFLKQ